MKTKKVILAKGGIVISRETIAYAGLKLLRINLRGENVYSASNSALCWVIENLDFEYMHSDNITANAA